MDTVRSVAVMGVGTMGTSMVTHLRDAGYEVYAYDVEPERAAAVVESDEYVADSAGEAARQSDVSIVVVGTYDQVETVICGEDGILEGGEEGHVVAISSTISPEDCIALGQVVSEHGMKPLGIPTCRGEKAAERGDLLVFVGGERSVYDDVAPVLHQFGTPENVVHLGPIGAGQAGKAANNSLLWSSVVANQEVFLLAKAYDLDLDVLRELLAKSTGGNWALGAWDWMHTKWAHKDMEIVLEMAHEHDVIVPSLALISQLAKDLDQEDFDRTR